MDTHLNDRFTEGEAKKVILEHESQCPKCEEDARLTFFENRFFYACSNCGTEFTTDNLDEINLANLKREKALAPLEDTKKAPTPVTKEQYEAILYWLETNVQSGPDNAYEKLRKAFPIIAPLEDKQVETQEEIWERAHEAFGFGVIRYDTVQNLMSKFIIKRKQP